MLPTGLGGSPHRPLTVAPLQGWRPLHSASSAGHEPVARLLISLGADVNAATAQQRTACHYAASKGQRELVELLLQHGAQVGWSARREAGCWCACIVGSGAC